MLLIVAQSNEATALAFSHHVSNRGIANEVLSEWCDVELTIEVERSRHTDIRLKTRAAKADVVAILNRGAPVPPELWEQASFVASETLAAWWSSLAMFPGPVVNKPSAQGFLPNVDVLSLTRTLGSGMRSPGMIACSPPPQINGVTNIHRLWDGSFVGRAGDTALAPGDLHLFTAFEPSKTVRLLLAGTRLFDLDSAHGEVKTEVFRRVESLVEELLRRRANFCYFVVQIEDPPLLLHTSIFPQVHAYRHVAEAVHDALLEYLWPESCV